MNKIRKYRSKSGGHMRLQALVILLIAFPVFAQDDAFFDDEGPLGIFGIKAVGVAALDQCDDLIRLAVLYQTKHGAWPTESSDLEKFVETGDVRDVSKSDVIRNFDEWTVEIRDASVFAVRFELKPVEAEELLLNRLAGTFEISLIDGTKTVSSVKVSGDMKIDVAEGVWQGEPFESDQLGKTSFIREIDLK